MIDPMPATPKVEVREGVIVIEQLGCCGTDQVKLTASQSKDLRTVLEQAEDWAQYWEDTYTCEPTERKEPER